MADSLPDPSAADRSTPVAPIWVVIDEGCQECGVSSVPIGAYLTENAARLACADRNEETGGWRDGGQTDCQVHRVSIGDAGASSVPTTEAGQ
jgi:hypothetical protein